MDSFHEWNEECNFFFFFNDMEFKSFDFVLNLFVFEDWKCSFFFFWKQGKCVFFFSYFHKNSRNSKEIFGRKNRNCSDSFNWWDCGSGSFDWDWDWSLEEKKEK